MTVNAPHDPQVDDLGLTSENWLDLQYARKLRHDPSPLPGPSKRKRSARWTTPAAKSGTSPPSRRPTKPGEHPGPIAHRRPSRNARPGNDHHRGRPRPQ